MAESLHDWLLAKNPLAAVLWDRDLADIATCITGDIICKQSLAWGTLDVAWGSLDVRGTRANRARFFANPVAHWLLLRLDGQTLPGAWEWWKACGAGLNALRETGHYIEYREEMMQLAKGFT